METSRDHARGGFTPYIHTRCPSCQKLYAVDPLPPSEVLPRFECTACSALFAIESPAIEGSFAQSYLIPAEPSPEYADQKPFVDSWPSRSAVVAAPMVETREQTQVYDQPNYNKPDNKPEMPTPVPARTPSHGSPRGSAQAKARTGTAVSSGMKTCPKCEVKNPPGREDCKACGVVFAKYVEADEERIADEIALGSRPELVLLWKNLIEDYDNETRHEEFIMACAKAEALPFASQKYQRIIQAAPDEQIARKMKKRIVQIASIDTLVPRREAKALPQFRLPRMNSLVILLGSIVFFFGMMAPGYTNMAGVGFSMVALAIGLRVFGNRTSI